MRCLPVFLLMAFMMTACAPAELTPTVTASPVPATATPRPPTSTATIAPTVKLEVGADQLLGAHLAEIGPAEIARAHVAEHERCENMGTFRLEFTADGRWSIQQTPHPTCGPLRWPALDGTWQLVGDEVVFADPKSPGCPTRYVYRLVSLDGGLKFAKVEDDCSPRTVVFTAHAWRPAPAVAKPTPTPIPTADFAPESLLGTWTRADPERGQLYLTFTPEGKYLAAHGEPTSSVHGGDYRLAGRVLTFENGWRDCEAGSYVITLSPSKALVMHVLSDRSCRDDRMSAFHLRRWNWVQP